MPQPSDVDEERLRSKIRNIFLQYGYDLVVSGGKLEPHIDEVMNLIAPQAIDEELGRILVNLYLGSNTTEKMPEWRAQLKNPEIAEAIAAIKQLLTGGGS